MSLAEAEIMEAVRRFIRAKSVWLWVARHLPWQLLYWATIVVWSHATTGKKFGSTVAPSLTVAEALERWPLCRQCGALRHRVCSEGPP